jgi:hypothetical protein
MLPFLSPQLAMMQFFNQLTHPSIPTPRDQLLPAVRDAFPSITLPSLVSAPSLAATMQTAPQSTPIALVLPRKISLDEFCERYDIPPQDKAKLEILDVIPGDHDALLTLEREDWAAAGFAKLGWTRFLAKHARFVEDVRNGLWD